MSIFQWICWQLRWGWVLVYRHVTTEFKTGSVQINEAWKHRRTGEYREVQRFQHTR